MQPLDRTGRVGGEMLWGNFYARVSSFISAAIEKLAGGRRCVKTVWTRTRMDPSFAAVAAIPAKQIPCHL